MKYLYWASLCLALPIVCTPISASQSWQIAGKNVLTFTNPDSGTRINLLNERLKQISIGLSLNNSWVIEQEPVFITQTTKDAKGKPQKVKKLQSIGLLLEGAKLLEVTETDVTNNNALTLKALADSWTSSLNELFRQPEVRRFVIISQVAPSQLAYRSKTYILNPVVVPDRGLFRTTGKQIEGKVIFWEVPANDRTYLIDGKTKQELEKTALNPSQIFIFDPRLQFIPYSLQQ